jgi:HTH-type transcriptional regulator/antitoxin HigA
MAVRVKALPDSYFHLIQAFPLVSIRDGAHLDQATAVIDRFLPQKLDRGGRAYLETLTQLVGSYEDEHIDIPDASEADVLRELMRSNGLSQAKLAKQTGISQSTICAVLTGARELTKDQVMTLAQRFHVSPMAFLPRGR